MADYRPPYPFVPSVAHYYGDHVRTVFIVVAGLMLVTAPFYGNSLRVELPFEILGALVLVAIGALANPHNKWVFMAGAVAAGVGLVIYEMWALYGYQEGTIVQFVLRELIALLFLAGFYFNMKTVRAFLLHKVGRREGIGEFEESSREGRMLKRESRESGEREEFLPWNHRKGSTPAGKADDDSGPRNSPGRSREEIMPKYHPYEERL
jgi:hypothetical protein